MLRSSKRFGQTTMAICLALAPLLANGRARATESLRPPMAEISQAVAQVLKARGMDSITVGDFTGPPSFGSSSGPGIRKLLIEELAKAGIRERKIGAELGIQGKYLVDLPADSQTGAARLRIEASLVDRSGQTLTNLNVESKTISTNDEFGFTDTLPISNGRLEVPFSGGLTDLSGAGALAETLGATVDLWNYARNIPRGGNVVIESFDQPTAVTHGGTAVTASRESPFRVEILVNGQPRPLRQEDGQPFVELAKDESFEIQLTNQAKFDCAAVVLLDGVNSFAFSEIRNAEGNPKYTRWILPPGRSFALKGWHKTNEHVEKFLIADFADSAAAKVGSTSGLGALTVTFRATWLEGQTLPDKPLPDPNAPVPASTPGGAARPRVGVGFGERAEQSVQESRDQREYGQPRAVVTIRYAKPE